MDMKTQLSPKSFDVVGSFARQTEKILFWRIRNDVGVVSKQ